MAFFCPICKRPVSERDGLERAGAPSHFPFCSERCKLIDLGRWLDGKYQIPAAEDELDESSDADQELPGRST